VLEPYLHMLVEPPCALNMCGFQSQSKAPLMGVLSMHYCFFVQTRTLFALAVLYLNCCVSSCLCVSVSVRAFSPVIDDAVACSCSCAFWICLDLTSRAFAPWPTFGVI
jgi:hypothetical protein